ncbi:MAG: hypothetical protein A2Z65_13665 [Gallionellales bacterium RIFCSPLOWO2_02_58_13]|nr:MAG: hypothetical protein A2Z65_13665 [Gallionellales bacterium RIFCSPLOWO2_02_58_13]
MRNLIWKGNPARPPAKLSGAFEHGGGDAARGEGDSGGHAGVAAADDGRASSFVIVHRFVMGDLLGLLSPP